MVKFLHNAALWRNVTNPSSQPVTAAAFAKTALCWGNEVTRLAEHRSSRILGHSGLFATVVMVVVVMVMMFVSMAGC